MLEVVAVIWVMGCLVFILSKGNNPKAFRNFMIGLIAMVILSTFEDFRNSPFLIMAATGLVALSCAGLKEE